ncbi:hypothetical protein [Aureivirga sp. CE67]|uniref:hypothetical protein n=1 Tax=Aureivirga sp. CE67 TaxID=1788983 RepID=UPI0018CBE822|nr:hypothetical protein [Aureivirga sp. CE67]
MDTTKISEIENLKGGILIEELENLIEKQLNIFNAKGITWREGIEILNDLLYLKEHDGSVLSDASCKTILNWIRNNYDASFLGDFNGSFSGHDEKADLYKDFLFLYDLINNTTRWIAHYEETPYYFKELEQKAKNDFEKYRLGHAIELIEYYIKERKKPPIPKKELDNLMLRVDDYFEKNFKEDASYEQLCGLREGVMEYDYCYTIPKILTKDKYVSSVKRTTWIGTGSLLVSKITDDIELTGSAPVDWVRKFELKIRGLDEYWYVEIPFDKRKLYKFTEIFDLSEVEVFEKVTNHKIILEEPINTDRFLGETYYDMGFLDEKSKTEYLINPSFMEIINKCNAAGIKCKLKILNK